MDIARFNFSHGSHEEQKGRMDALKKIRREEGKHIAILLDTKGPEIRVAKIKNDKEEEITELARMLGGVTITETTMESAREMKELANSTKYNGC